MGVCGSGEPDRCENTTTGMGVPVRCCYWSDSSGTCQECLRITIDPWEPDPTRRPNVTGVAAVPQGRKEMRHMQCKPGCDCHTGHPTVPGPTGVPISVQPAGGRGEGLCWGVAGGRASPTEGGVPAVIPTGPFFITITVRNYTWLQPRKLTMTVVDPAGAVPSRTASGLVRVTRVESVGRQVIGSVQGISARSIDSESDNALTFGRDVSAITSSNDILVAGTNLSATSFDIFADVEGVAQQ